MTHASYVGAAASRINPDLSGCLTVHVKTVIDCQNFILETAVGDKLKLLRYFVLRSERRTISHPSLQNTGESSPCGLPIDQSARLTTDKSYSLSSQRYHRLVGVEDSGVWDQV